MRDGQGRGQHNWGVPKYEIRGEESPSRVPENSKALDCGTRLEEKFSEGNAEAGESLEA